MERKNQTDYSKGKISYNVLRLALPMMVAELVHILYNLVDRMYIGHMENGTVALTGIGLVLPLITATAAFANIGTTGGSPLSAIALGAGKREEAQSIQETAFTLLILVGMILTVVFAIFKKSLILLLGGTQETLPAALTYFDIYLCGTLFSVISLGMNAFINMQGFPSIGMKTVLIGAVSNILLDPLFIFAFDMGVAGAALATVISQLFSCLWSLRFFFGKIAPLPIRRLGIDRTHLKSILSLGTAGFCFKMTNSVTQAVVNITLRAWGGALSTLYISAMSIINSLREVIYMPVQAVTDASKPVMSYNYGAEKIERMQECIRFMTVFCLILNLLFFGILHLFPKTLAGIFTSDSDLLTLCVPCIHRYYLVYFMMTFQSAGQAVFVALNKPKHAVFFALFRKLMLIVPFTLLLPHLGLGAGGVFYAEAISDLVGGSICYLTMLSVIKKMGLTMRTRKKGEGFEKKDCHPGRCCLG
ncbi:MAG: MATE family efflux transporter [Lachnospiraceae bacterium]|nr:MATE family efflux transporter [Clostridia bacterium]MBR6359707.1 MATE family efflux transporter [Lachnospiraceae bacterium]